MTGPRTAAAALLAFLLALPTAGGQEPPTPAPPEAPPPVPPAASEPGAGEPAQESPETPSEKAQPPVAPPAQPAPPAPPPASRLDFDLTFPADQGGGQATGSAGSLEYRRDDYAVLAGEVKIKYQDVELQADRAEIDLDTKIVTATGNVIIDQGPRRLTGATATFDLDTKTGTLSEATGQVSPDYYFTGREVAKTGDDTYAVTDGVFTSCNQKVPDWSFRLGRAVVEVEGYARVRNASMRAKRLPVFYTPYILWPAKSERTAGFLIPNFGYSDRRGTSLGLAYFQTLGRSYDTTFHLDLFSQNFLGVGDELRYRPTEGTRGAFVGYAVRDPGNPLGGEDWRWKVEWNHATTDLPWGMRGVVSYQDFSDFNFFRDFERDFDRNTLRSIESRAFLTGNWGAHLLNVLVHDQETFLDLDRSINLSKLPEIEYRLRSTRLGRTPLYLQVRSSADYLDVTRPGSYSGTYERFDAFPQLTLPVRSFPWLSLSVTGGGRLTWYGDSLDETTRSTFTGESLTRAVPTASAQVVGPSFSRLFGGIGGIGGFSRFKHVVEPRWTYNYQSEFDDFARVPLFDEVDGLRATNFGRLALVNRFLGKPADEEGSAREVLLIELARSYSFDDAQPLQLGRNGTLTSQAGPLEALVRFSPSLRTSVKAEATYDTLFSRVTSTSLSGNAGFRGNDFGLTWFTRYRGETGEEVANQLRVSGGVNVLPRKLRFEGQVNYDFDQQLLQQQRYILNYNSQCYGVRLELRDFRAGVGPRRRDKDFRFSLTLRNVGTFLDLTGRSSTTEEP